VFLFGVVLGLCLVIVEAMKRADLSQPTLENRRRSCSTPVAGVGALSSIPAVHQDQSILRERAANEAIQPPVAVCWVALDVWSCSGGLSDAGQEESFPKFL
jgi:hypothetical protein